MNGRPSVSSTVYSVSAVQAGFRNVQLPLASTWKTISLTLSTTLRYWASLARSAASTVWRALTSRARASKGSETHRAATRPTSSATVKAHKAQSPACQRGA